MFRTCSAYLASGVGHDEIPADYDEHQQEDIHVVVGAPYPVCPSVFRTTTVVPQDIWDRLSGLERCAGVWWIVYSD